MTATKDRWQIIKWRRKMFCLPSKTQAMFYKKYSIKGLQNSVLLNTDMISWRNTWKCLCKQGISSAFHLNCTWFYDIHVSGCQKHHEKSSIFIRENFNFYIICIQSVLLSGSQKDNCCSEWGSKAPLRRCPWFFLPLFSKLKPYSSWRWWWHKINATVSLAA